jgi:hypothetical protein
MIDYIKQHVEAAMAFALSVITAVGLITHCLLDKEKFMKLFGGKRNDRS